MRAGTVVALLILASCAGGASGAVVDMPTAHVFEPETITIKAGETITWTNSSSEQHTVTADESSLPDGAPYFSSGNAPDEKAANDNPSDQLIGAGDKFEFTFDTPGAYSYYCILHRSDGMEGTIKVEP